MYNDKGFYFATIKGSTVTTVAQYNKNKHGNDWEIIGSDEPFYEENSTNDNAIDAVRFGKILIIGKEIINL